MTVRTTNSSVTFAKPFRIGDLDEVLPPGQYDVETDEELLQGLSFDAYRRILTLIHIPAKPGHSGLARTLTIHPDELDAALLRDTAQTTALAVQQPRDRPSPEPPRPDRRALDQAENEGMTAQPHATGLPSSPPKS